MKYIPDLYDYDRSKISDQASLREGALLYCMTTTTYCSRRFLLKGDGPPNKTDDGRWHRVNQPTTYCANNVLVNIAEMLYHQYRMALQAIEDRQPISHVNKTLKETKVLAVIKTHVIDNLVYVDSQDVLDAHNFYPTLLVFPDHIYGPLHDIGDTLRKKGIRGVFSPSARHSRDLCIVFFKDETKQLASFKPLGLTLRLLKEEQDLSAPPEPVDLKKDTLHATMGYYQFDDANKFERLCRTRVIHPSNVPPSGYVEFVRRH